MRPFHLTVVLTAGIVILASVGSAQNAPTVGPYKVLKTVNESPFPKKKTNEYRSDSFYEGTNLLPHTADFDEAIENPKTLDILRSIIGEEITFEEFAVMLRNPTANLNEVKGWHRDLIREYDRRMEIDAVSIMMPFSWWRKPLVGIGPRHEKTPSEPAGPRDPSR